MKQMHVVFHGTVQGVGFRYATKHIVKRYPVTGFVKNLSNGCVELLAEGEESQLQSLLKDIQKSPLKHYIRETDVQWNQMTGKYETFSVAFEF